MTRGSSIAHGAAGRGPFPPRVVIEIKALACARPADLSLPLTRLSVADIARAAVARDIVEAISTTTVWRWLREDALRPWTYRSWLFPRDPDFERKAGRVLDLYHGRWLGEPLRPDEHVICADEKTAIQARARIHPSAVRRHPDGPAGSSTSMCAEGRSPISPPGTSTGQRSSGAASRPPASSRSGDSSTRS